MADPLRVLYVDDEPGLLNIGKLFLERSGDFSVATNVSASAALELLKKERYDAIVSDYQMPDIDGIEFLMQLRASENTTPFIIFTGKGREEVIIEALNNGADFYLQKGGDPKAQFAELSNKIRYAVSRRKVEEDLSESQKRTADIIEFLPDATFAINTKGEVIAWNKAIEEMTGVPAIDMLGKGDYEYAIPFYEIRRPILIDLVSIPDEELTRGEYAIVKKEGDLLIAETTLPRPLGRYSVLHGKASLLYNKQGEAIGAIESIRDITEQKQAEIELIRKNDELYASYEQIAAAEEEMRAQLNELKQTQQNIQESEEKYRTLIEHCMDAVFIAQDGCIAAVNPAFSSMTGYTEEELIGQPLTMPIAPEDQEMVLSRHKRRLAGYEEPNTYEFSMVHKDKQTRLRVVMSVGAGKYQGRSATIGTIHDVTMERNREDLLRESEMRFHQLSDAADDGLVMHKHGSIQEVNTSACNLFGYSHDELIGMDVLDLTAPGSEDIVREKIQTLSEAPYEMEGLKKGGTRFFGTFHSRNITFKNQQVRLTSVRDITESRRSEEALKHQSETLSILNGIIITANKADTLPGLLSSILEESLRLMDFDAGGIYLVNHTTRTADVVQSKNLPPEFLVKIQTVLIDKSPYDRVFIRKEPIFTENYAKINPGLSKKFGFQSAAIVPLLSKGVAVGALNIASTKRYIISEEEKQTLISIGRELGSTIERMASEEDAKKASKNLETLFNSIDEMVFVLDMQGNIISVNDTVLKRLLYSSEELSGMNVLLLHVPERRCEALQIVQGMIAGTIDSCPVPVVSKDGTRIEVETKINRALWNNQEVLIGVTRDVTERKCAEEALRESEDKLQLALFGSATGMWELNIPSMIGAIDDRAADILGYKKIAIGSRSIDWDELSHPDDVPLIQKRLEDYLDGRTTIFESEHRMRHVSGEWVWVVGRGKITQYSEDRSSLRISGTLHNITNRKRTELELVTAQQRLKEAHQLAHIGTFDWNLETDTVTWSEQLFNIAGRDPLSGAPAYGDLPSLYSDTSWDLLNGAVTRSLSTGDPFNLELEMIRSDGSKRWTNNFGGVKHDEKGKLIRFFGTVQDINERKRVEEALEKAQEKYTKAFLASPDAITITDMETGRFVEVNDTTSRIYGYSRDEMIGKSAVELGIWLRNEDREDFIGKVKINGRVERYEAIGRQKSGKMFNGSISADIIKIGDSLHLISVIRDITERKIADEALRESEARVRKILEQAPLPLCYVNKDGVITFRNERFVQIFGYTAEDFPTLTEWWQQAYPDAHYRQWVTTTWDAALKRAIENGIDIRPVEYRVTCKSGEERIIEITGIILGDDFLATFIDLTERKQTEEKLQETNEYLNSLIDYANAPIIVWDPEYVITRFNHAFEDLAFMPEQEVIGQRLDILFPKESRGASLHQIQKTLEGEQWESVEIPILVKDGSVRTVLWNSANIVYPDGRILSTIAQGVDITDRKKAEEALGESEEQFRISIEKAPEAILLFDINQDRYIEANVEAERIFGCSRQQLLDSGPQQFYKPDQPDLQPIRETVDEHRRRVIAGEAIVFERYIRTTREEDLVMEVRLVLLQSTKRKLIRSSFIDITERKRAEEALSLAIKKLNLLSGITRHDINNQLTVLMGFLSILEEKYQDRSLSEYFQKVSKAAQRISSMIRFTKEYEEIGVHAPKWQDCHTIVDSVSKQAALGKVEVKNDLPVGAEVFADPLILKVFYNLMDNAVRYGGKITTIWFSVEGRGDVKVLVCEDDGDGVAANEKEKIFERGFGKNTGLGLALAREILDITGITITETGEPGKGARFEMTVPKGMWRMKNTT